MSVAKENIVCTLKWPSLKAKIVKTKKSKFYKIEPWFFIFSEYNGDKFGMCVGANGNMHDRTLRSDNLNHYLIEMAKCVASFGRPR